MDFNTMKDVEILDVDDTVDEKMGENESDALAYDQLLNQEFECIQNEMSERRSLEDIQAEKEALLNLRDKILEEYGEWSDEDHDPDQKKLVLTRTR